MGVPIPRGGRVLGVLVVQNRTRRHYTDEETESLETIAMLLAEMIAGGGLIAPDETRPIDGISLRKLPWGDMYAWYQDYLVKEKRLIEQREKEAARTVAELDRAVKAFRKDCGRYPKSLKELIERPAALNMSWESKVGRWPYVKNARLPLDPWGQHYRYLVPGRHHPDAFDVWSARGNSRNPDGWIGNWNAH